MPVHELESAIQTGMLIAYHAERTPDVSAVVSNYGDRTFGETEDVPAGMEGSYYLYPVLPRRWWRPVDEAQGRPLG